MTTIFFSWIFFYFFSLIFHFFFFYIQLLLGLGGHTRLLALGRLGLVSLENSNGFIDP